MMAPIFIKSKEEALPDVKNWYARIPSVTALGLLVDVLVWC